MANASLAHLSQPARAQAELDNAERRAHCQAFFTWYNTAHRHSGIGFMTPQTVHYGRATELTRVRSIALDNAFQAHPHRFKGVAPRPPEVPVAAWINPQSTKEEGVPPNTRNRRSLTKFTHPGVAKSLTRSGRDG
jgi:putative transposase